MVVFRRDRARRWPSGQRRDREGRRCRRQISGVRCLLADIANPCADRRDQLKQFLADQGIGTPFFEQRVERAYAARAGLLDAANTGIRIVHGESDGLPGVIADRYGNVVVLQNLSAGAERWRDVIAQALMSVAGARAVYERSDVEVRALEGLTPRAGIVAGVLPRTVTMFEGGLCYTIDVIGGQKTGFYLDQRDNRALVRRLAKDKRVLNAFCYTGAFTLAALAGGAASVLSIDSAADALALARENLSRNPTLPAERATWREGNVFAELRQLRDTGAQFDLIVLDPPKFAPTAAHVERAARAYKDINLWALKLLAPGGLLATFSCSGGMTADLFQKIVAGAAIDADGRCRPPTRSQRRRRPAVRSSRRETECSGTRRPAPRPRAREPIHAACR